MCTKETIKIANYDDFKCIADSCRFTCCDGWAVDVDEETYTKWMSGQGSSYILKHVGKKKRTHENRYFIKKRTQDKCPFLDRHGLCNIVKTNGEEYLSLTCHSFPRIENEFNTRIEKTLSCACPEVVNMVEFMDNLSWNFNDEETCLRNMIIRMIDRKEYSLEVKLLMVFRILEEIQDNKDNIAYCEDKEYLDAMAEAFSNMEDSNEEALEELNFLFMDIIENYKEVAIMEPYLSDISFYGSQLSAAGVMDAWKSYRHQFQSYDELMSKYLKVMVYNSCNSSEPEEVLEAFQLVFLEYILIRYAVFLKYSMEDKKEISTEAIKDYIVVFSRVVGNNSEAVYEFIEDGFGSIVFDLGYLCYITLF